jgi:hypothetical protein
MRDDLDDYLISIGKVAIAAAFLEEVVIHWGVWLSDNPQGTLLRRSKEIVGFCHDDILSLE